MDSFLAVTHAGGVKIYAFPLHVYILWPCKAFWLYEVFLGPFWSLAFRFSGLLPSEPLHACSERPERVSQRTRCKQLHVELLACCNTSCMYLLIRDRFYLPSQVIVKIKPSVSLV